MAFSTSTGEHVLYVIVHHEFQVTQGKQVVKTFQAEVSKFYQFWKLLHQIFLPFGVFHGLAGAYEGQTLKHLSSSVWLE